MATLLIILNPYNLVALFFASNGLAMWGSGEHYKIDSSFFTLLKVFGLPTITFALAWVGLKKWKKLNFLKMYVLSFLISLMLITLGTQIYWGIIGRK